MFNGDNPPIKAQGNSKSIRKTWLGNNSATRHHIIMTKPGHIATLSIPDHTYVARGTLRSLIARAGISLEEFLDSQI